MIATVNNDNEKPMDTTEPDDGVAAASDDDDSSQLGTKVEAKFQSKWLVSFSLQDGWKKNVICVFLFCIFFLCSKTSLDVETSFCLFTFFGMFSYLCNYTYRQIYRFCKLYL